MKLKFITDVSKLYSCLSELKPYQKIIDDAKASGNKEAEYEAILKATQVWSDSLIKKFGIKVTVIGKENLPTEGGVLFVGNHQGNLDPLIMYNAIDTVPFGSIAKKEILKVPKYNKWMERINCIFLDRGNPRASLKSITTAIELINDKFSVLVFPEGTRSQSTEMGTMKSGAFKIATKTKAPIIPFSINGTFKLFEEHGKIVPGEVFVKIHPPINTVDMTKEESRSLPSIVEQIVADGVRELNELYPIQ
ncbi:MAG: lysophospholipid acyltransferase family protein [Eubacteriales bacterium]|nr:lysophospholipid acyltransferase family protein [Eubacteriales bacterium]MDY3332458.1 lysophospholipid acyltransferase family protein [Gallibacter sp.]